MQVRVVGVLLLLLLVVVVVQGTCDALVRCGRFGAEISKCCIQFSEEPWEAVVVYCVGVVV